MHALLKIFLRELKMPEANIGLIGLAVMGQNLVLNMERNGYVVAVYNRTAARTDEFMAGSAAGKDIQAAYSIQDFVQLLERPRRVMIMVKAGAAVDAVIAQLKPYLEAGDLVIDGGNSYFHDSERRAKELESAGFRFLGVGVSGGEEGALWGPSIMPGGHKEAYDLVEPIFTAISAKVKGEACVTYIGPRGAGHFVKMVHNGIEYGDMQLIAETYDLLKRGVGLSNPELSEIFSRWNEGVLSSYLIEITGKIFRVHDAETGKDLVDVILDEAQQKGTGKWTSQEALEEGVPTPTINAAVEARLLSSLKDERVGAAEILSGASGGFAGERTAFIEALGKALYASKICSYAQGMSLLQSASQQYDYKLKLGEAARIWRGGCIIRARFLDDVTQAFNSDARLPNLMLAPFFRQALLDSQADWRSVMQQAARMGIPTPAMSASLAYFDGYRSQRLPANLTQAQRDFFGAHTYQRLDKPGIFHTEWGELTRSP
jgi:6-phosphogluconate dehydrogenase